MKQKIRFLLATLLAIAFTQGAWAQTTIVYGNHTYSLSGMQAKLVSLQSGTTSVVVPEFVLYNGINYTVTEVSSSLQCYTTLQSITLPTFLTKFDGFPSDYSALKTIDMSKCVNVTTIGERACANLKSLVKVTLPASVKTIESYAFYGCTSLTTINLDYVTSYGESSFQNCSSLASLSLTGATLGARAFQGCSGLTTLTLNNCKWADGSAYHFVSCTSLKNLTLTQMESISSSCFYGCSALESVALESPCSSLGESAFSRCTSLKSVTLGEEIKAISESAFSGCSSLNSVTLGSAVNTIGASAFSGCSSLEQITLPESLYYIQDYAFRNCKLTQITLPQKMISIGHYAFSSLSDIYCMGKNLIGVDSYFYQGQDAGSVTVHVPVGYTEKCKLLQGWNRSVFNFVESGQITLNVNANSSNGQLQVWTGNSRIGTVSSSGGTLSKKMELPSSVQLRIPNGYLDKILLNGEDVTSSLAKTTLSDGYTEYTIEKFSEVTNIYVISNYEHYELDQANAELSSVKKELSSVKDELAQAKEELSHATVLGDINGDGQVTIADVTKLVNMILGKE